MLLLGQGPRHLSRQRVLLRLLKAPGVRVSEGLWRKIKRSSGMLTGFWHASMLRMLRSRLTQVEGRLLYHPLLCVHLFKKSWLKMMAAP